MSLKALQKQVQQKYAVIQHLNSQIKLAEQCMGKIGEPDSQEADQAMFMLELSYMELLRVRQAEYEEGQKLAEKYDRKKAEVEKLHQSERIRSEKLARFRRRDSAWFREAKSFTDKLKASIDDRRGHKWLAGVKK